MNERFATAGASAAQRWVRPLLVAFCGLMLVACGTTPQRLPADTDPTQAEAVPPTNTDALSAPANEAPSVPPPSDIPPPKEPPTPPPPDAPPDVPPPDGAPPPSEQSIESPPTDALPQDDATTATEKVLERTRRSVRSSAWWLARGVDSWFGDKPFDEGGEVKDGRLSIGFFKRREESLDTRIRFNARIRLPNVEQRAYLFVGRDNEREVVSDTPGAFSRQDRQLTETREDRSFFTGLGLSLRDNIDLRLGFHGIKPYAQARYKQPWSLSERDLVEFRQTFFWRVSDQLGSTTVLSYEHALQPTLALRWLTAATITQKTEKFDWSSIVGAYKSFSNQRLLSFEGITSGRLGTGVTVGEYGLQLKWLQTVYRDWLLGEALLGYFWPRVELFEERSTRWAVGYALTMRF